MPESWRQRLSDVAQFFPQVFETNEGWKANCPRCEDNEKKFCWSMEKKVGCCMHSSCPWFYQRGGVTERRLLAFFSRGGIHRGIPNIVEARDKGEGGISLPKEFLTIRELDTRLRDDLYAYLEHRGITKRIVDKTGIGYCEEGRFWGYILFPVFDDEGELVWWQGRRFKNREPKFYNPKCSHKREIVYRVNPTSAPRTIVLVESIINALTLETMETSKTLVLALLGKSMSEEQRDYVLQFEKRLREIVIALDGDARRDAVRDIASKFEGIVPVIRVVKVPDGEDINSLGREKSWQLIRQAPVCTAENRMALLYGDV